MWLICICLGVKSKVGDIANMHSFRCQVEGGRYSLLVIHLGVKSKVGDVFNLHSFWCQVEGGRCG